MGTNWVSLLMRGSCRQSFRSFQSIIGACQCSRVIELSPQRYFHSLPPSFQLSNVASAAHKLSANPAPLPPKEDSSNDEETLARLSETLNLGKRKRLLEEQEETEPHLIYKGVLSDQMRRLKMFSLTTSAMGLMMQPILIQRSSEIPLAGSIAVFGMVGFFTIGTPFLIHLIAKKYVTEVMYDPQNDVYEATTFTFFMRKKKTVFKIDDVKVPDVPGPFTTLTVKNEKGNYDPFFLASEAFLKTSHYGRLMGYDKPINLHLTPQNEDSKSKPESSEANNK